MKETENKKEMSEETMTSRNEKIEVLYKFIDLSCDDLKKAIKENESYSEFQKRIDNILFLKRKRVSL